jgi:hypothetical protein
VVRQAGVIPATEKTDSIQPLARMDGLPDGARVRADRVSGPWAADIMRARCGHCGARTSNQMLRRRFSTAERTMTPVRQQEEEKRS